MQRQKINSVFIYRKPEKTLEDQRRPEKTREDPRRPEKTTEDPRKKYIVNTKITMYHYNDFTKFTVLAPLPQIPFFTNTIHFL